MADIPLEDLQKAIDNTLTLYSTEVTDKILKVVDDITKEAKKELRVAGSFRNRSSKGYRQGWEAKTISKNRWEKTVVVYNKEKPQLTHLLEYGHVKRGGRGLVRAFPHIAPVEEKAVKDFEKKIQEIIENT